jgi:hypothetical protein
MSEFYRSLLYNLSKEKSLASLAQLEVLLSAYAKTMFFVHAIFCFAYFAVGSDPRL